jgi:hypothetical protein
MKKNTLELRPVPDSKTYTAAVRGQRAVVCFYERNRAEAAHRFDSVAINEAVWKDARKLAKNESLPLFVGLQIRVGGKLDSGYLVPLATFTKFKLRECDMGLGKAARTAYAEDAASMIGVRFVIAKAAAK